MVLGEGYKVYLYDNSPECAEVREAIQGRPDAVYLTAGRNVGLGVGLSSICAQAYYDGQKALLFLDQDTVLQPGALSSMSDFYRSRRSELHGYCAVNFDPARTGDAVPRSRLRDVSIIINSGTLFILDSLERMNWHDTSYFVDGVDYKFCLDAQLCNFRIGMYSGIDGFDHETEQGNEPYRILNRIYPARRYSLSRIFDVARSYSRIVLCSIRSGRWGFGVKILRLLAAYLLIQAYVRLLKPQE